MDEKIRIMVDAAILMENSFDGQQVRASDLLQLARLAGPLAREVERLTANLATARRLLPPRYVAADGSIMDPERCTPHAPDCAECGRGRAHDEACLGVQETPAEEIASLLATADAQQHWHTRAARAEAKVERLRAELEEARLTLAAEQGMAEGAPSAGWAFDGRDWSKNYPDGSFAGLSGRRGKRRWMRALWPDTERAPNYLGRGHDVETDRAAMKCADAAYPSTPAPAPE